MRNTFHWVDNLAALGNVDPSVSANYPLAAVFTKSGQRTYVISNLTTASLTVTFSNGETRVVEPDVLPRTGGTTPIAVPVLLAFSLALRLLVGRRAAGR